MLIRFTVPNILRGVGGTGRSNAIAEIWYTWSCVFAIGLGWIWFGNAWLGVLPCLFLSFGDTVTGLTRTIVYKRETKGTWGSAMMLFVCLGLAGLLYPYWIGVVGAVVATVAEKYTKTSRFVDDNLTLTVSSAIVMGVAYGLWG